MTLNSCQLLRRWCVGPSKCGFGRETRHHRALPRSRILRSGIEPRPCCTGYESAWQRPSPVQPAPLS